MAKSTKARGAKSGKGKSTIRKQAKAAAASGSRKTTKSRGR